MAGYPTCGLVHTERSPAGLHLVSDCSARATVKFVGLDGWGQQYACDEHAAVIAAKPAHEGWHREAVK